ncbi:MAG: hypothetical protein ABSG43_00230 [Solirubrobacteraceae bacterium]|jgi:hypothetical protein
MAAPSALFGRLLVGGRRGHVATTAHVMAAYPFMAQASLGALGVLIGVNVYGGSFALDPWELYRLGILHDPNMLVLGLKDYGKSALCKTLALRHRVFGRRIEVLDGKGEYAPLMAAMGGVAFRVRPGCGVNPIERIGSRASRESLLRAVARSLLGRELAPGERLGLTAALTAADVEHSEREVVIPDVVEQLRNPGAHMLAELQLSPRRAQHELREVGYALRDLSTGPLAGLFDQPTSRTVDWTNPAISIDLSSIAKHAHGADQNVALAVALISCTAFLDAQRHEEKERAGVEAAKTIRLNDESWRPLAVAGAAEYYNSSLKLSRDSGVSYVIVLHRLSDLSATGDDGSRQQHLAEGLAAECATRVIYRQDPSEVQTTARTLMLTSTERELLPTLGQGEALWRVGERGFRVAHQVAAAEWDAINTDAAMGERRVRRTVG